MAVPRADCLPSGSSRPSRSAIRQAATSPGSGPPNFPAWTAYSRPPSAAPPGAIAMKNGCSIPRVSAAGDRTPVAVSR